MAVATRPRTEVPINLLPPQIRSQQRVRRSFRWAAGGAIALAVILLSVTVMQRLQISSEQNELREQRAQAASLQQRVDELKEFEVLQASIDENRTILATALTGDVLWSRFLDDLDTKIPGDAWVTNVTMSAKPGQTPIGETSLGTVQYQGYVMSFPGLSGWLNTMEELEGMRFVYLSSGNKVDFAGQKIVNFTASGHLTESMLSGRCQTEDSPCP